MRALFFPSKTVNLALQGGGAHGAFTWGVLDALLEDGRLSFDAISGTSAGAMNAVVFAQGWMAGGRDGARQALANYWGEISRRSYNAFATSGQAKAPTLSAMSKMFMKWTSHLSPYELNPMDHNPLREVVQQQIDFEGLRRHSPFKLFIAATHANSGQLRVFREHELTAAMLLASACLPTLHHSIEVEGQPYWDGGFSANPPVSCFMSGPRCARNVLLVLLSPLMYREAPRAADEIKHRVLELGFTTSFLAEMRVLAQALRHARGSVLPLGRWERRVSGAHFHIINAEDLDAMERAETKLITNAPFLETLRDLGRERAQGWLDRHYEAVGRCSTVELGELFDGR